MALCLAIIEEVFEPLKNMLFAFNSEEIKSTQILAQL